MEPDLTLFHKLVPRLRMLVQFVRSLGSEQLNIKGKPTIVQKPLSNLVVSSRDGIFILFGRPGSQPDRFSVISDHYFLSKGSSDANVYSSIPFTTVSYDKLPGGERRLFDSIITTASSLCWSDFMRKLGSKLSFNRQVFISYRKGNEEFARALSTRLGEEGFVPWFDEWEIVAGDSVPRKIEDGLRNSVAFIPIIAGDYSEGKWATEELQSSVHRRIEEGFPIIPVLLDSCEKPELIRHLRHVDFSDHDPQKFEGRVAEIVDGINRLSKNPFR